MHPTTTHRRPEIIIQVAGVLIVVMALTAALGRDASFAYGDVELYERWARETLVGAGPLADASWVYPPVAMVPMLIPALFTSTSEAYLIGWFVESIVFNVAALVVLWWRYPTRPLALWWYVAFIGAVGTTTVSRIDSLATPLALIALVLVSSSPVGAGVSATLGAWLKIAPAATVLAMVAGWKDGWKKIVLAAIATSAVVIGTCSLVWQPASAWSFLTGQVGRGLQVESVAATAYMLAGALAGKSAAEWNSDLITYEVATPGASHIAQMLDPIMLVAVIVVSVLLLRRASGSRHTLAMGALALTTILIVANKVGSPQFVIWLGAPAAFGVAVLPRVQRRIVAAVVLSIAVLTQVLFPWNYLPFLAGDLAATIVDAIRNLIMLALAIYAGASLLRRTAPHGRDRTTAPHESGAGPHLPYEQPDVEPQPSHT